MTDYTTYFSLDNTLCYLNHAGASPWPSRTRDAVVTLADELVRQGSVGYAGWTERDRQTHERVAAMINAGSADEIALVRNTSDGLSMVAHGLGWAAGQNVVLPAMEFPSNRFPWQSLQTQGVEVRLVDIDGDGVDAEGALLAAMDTNTRLLAVSAVQFSTGLRMDLPRLAMGCRAHDALFCVDAIQQVGALPFDVQASGADFVAFGSHKWLLGPEGVGTLWMRPQWRERLKLHAFGWHMVEALGDFDSLEWRPAGSARRFEPGTTNQLGITALHASLGLFEELGMTAVGAALEERVEYLLRGLSALPGVSLATPREPSRRAGIVTFRSESCQPQDLHRHLVAAGVVCVPRAGGIRFSPHFYTPFEVLDRALGHVEDGLHKR